MSDKYAVMIPFDDEMLFVTHGDVKFQLGARLFDTEEKAEEHAAYGVRVLWWLSILRSKANE
jgi:hypothetical protein